MNPSIVFSKTPRGQTAIKERVHGLDHSLRLALILVDGHSSVDQLKLKAMSMNNMEQKLEVLALNGLIQAENESWQTTKDSTASAKTTSAPEVSKIKARLIDAAILVLGDDAHRIIKQLHNAPNDSQGLHECIARCKKNIQLTVDEDSAKELNELCQRILIDFDAS